jgi:hypothetical protein
MDRYRTYVEDGTVLVDHDDGPVEVGELDEVLEAVGGPAWTITYSEATKSRHPEMDTADEGLTVDVVDMLHAMTHSEQFVETLRTYPADPPEGGDLSPRTGLFVGKLLENLENGVA